MFRRTTVLLTCLAMLAGTAAFAAPPKPAPSASGKHTIQFRDVKLKNGLRVIISEDHSAPVFAIAVTYNVGSRDEVKGRTGFAHLFEHMMFQGSQNIGKGEHMLLVEENGGTMNGTTNSDRTNYFESLPANQLDLGLFLEADRMRALNVTQANLDNQRNAVQEERRLRVDNQPYGKSFEAFDELAYDNFGYKHSTIGSMADLNAASVQDVQSFFKTYYAPNNAVVALVGDFKTDEALAKVKKYFEEIPSQPAPKAVDIVEPLHNAERRLVLTDEFARMPRTQIGYISTKSNTPDFYALDMLMDILGGGQSSRLFQKIVKEQRLALQIGAFGGRSRGTGMVMISFMPAPGKDPAVVEKAIYEEIENIKKQAPEDWEIQKVLNTSRERRYARNQTSMARAMMLSEFTVFYNDPNLVNTMEDNYAKVTKADLVRVANTYLKDTNRVVLTTMPQPKQASLPTAPAGQ